MVPGLNRAAAQSNGIGIEVQGMRRSEESQKIAKSCCCWERAAVAQHVLGIRLQPSTKSEERAGGFVAAAAATPPDNRYERHQANQSQCDMWRIYHL
jgi:hypothetical protein